MDDDDLDDRSETEFEGLESSESDDVWLRPEPGLLQPKRLSFVAIPGNSQAVATFSERRLFGNEAAADRIVAERWGGRAYRVLSIDIGLLNLVLGFVDFEDPIVVPKSKRRRAAARKDVDDPFSKDAESTPFARSPWGDFVVRSVEVLDVLAEGEESAANEEDRGKIRTSAAGVKKSEKGEGVSLEAACRCVWEALEARRDRFVPELDRVVVELQPGGDGTGVRNPAVAHFILCYFFAIYGPDRVEFQSATRKLCVYFDPTFDPQRLYAYLADRRSDGKRTAKKKHESFLIDVARGVAPVVEKSRPGTLAECFARSLESKAKTQLSDAGSSSGATTSHTTKPGNSRARERLELTKTQEKDIVYFCNKLFSVHQVSEILAFHGGANSAVLRFVRSLDKKDDACDALAQAFWHRGEARRKAGNLPKGCNADVLRKYCAANKAHRKTRGSEGSTGKTTGFPGFKSRFRKKKS